MQKHHKNHCACNIICCTGPAILLMIQSITQAPTELVEFANIFGSILVETYQSISHGCFKIIMASVNQSVMLALSMGYYCFHGRNMWPEL